MPERLGDAPAAIYVLTNEDIARSGATSIPEALRLVPGVQVARVDSSTWAISVRGFNGPLTTAYHVDTLPGFSVPAYWRFDARLGWQLTDRWQVDLVGQNLFDDSHREFGAITAPNAIKIGRSVYGKVTWRP